MEHVFVADTNLFLECKRLEDIPWSELGVDPVVVLLTKPVLGEIDKHKKSSGRTRKRALAISGRIRGMLKSDVAEETVRAASPRVTLRLAPVVRPDADLGEILDYSSNDDRVVGIASALAKRDGTELVQFLTDDSVAASTAHSVGVAFRFIDEGWKRPPERTAEAKRAEELEEELDGYRSQEPRIVLGNATAEAVATRLVRRVPLPLGRAEVDALIDRLRARHPLQLELPVPEAEERDDGDEGDLPATGPGGGGEVRDRGVPRLGVEMSLDAPEAARERRRDGVGTEARVGASERRRASGGPDASDVRCRRQNLVPPAVHPGQGGRRRERREGGAGQRLFAAIAASTAAAAGAAHRGHVGRGSERVGHGSGGNQAQRSPHGRTWDGSPAPLRHCPIWPE